MSIDDLAAYLGDSKRTIYKYIASGDCPPYIRISAKNIKFDRADVDAWLESKKVIPQADQNDFENGALPWTPRAKRVMKAARQTAHEYELDSVGSEHILLGIMEVEDCVGAGILKGLGVEPAKARRLCEQLYEKGRVEPKGSGNKSKLTDNAQEVIRCAHQQAVRWGHEYIGAEHLLMGILLVDEGLGQRILAELGVTLENVQSETAKLIVCRNAERQ
jgi:excisionase family DNA binding protein